MGMAADLQRQPRGEARIGLAQLDPGHLGEDGQMRPRPLVEPRIGRIGDGLLHHGRIDRNALHAGLVDRPGFAPGRNGLGPQSFHPFLADPLASACQG